nr:hypothetical protein [Tanacetum cinerariifolium]
MLASSHYRNVSEQTTRSKDMMDAMIENGPCSNGTKKQAVSAGQEGKSKLAEKETNSDVVSSAHGTSSKAFGSPNTTPLVARINELERKGEQFEESDDEIEELDDDTSRYMSFKNRVGRGANDSGLLEGEDFDCYDG